MGVGLTRIGLDTSSAIYCFPSEFRQSQERADLFDRGQQLLRQCQENGDEIVVPSIVLGELLNGIPQEEWREFTRLLTQHVLVVPFDAASALVFARLFNSFLPQWRETTSSFRQAYVKNNMTRQKFKSDCLIIAAVVAAGCQCLYTEDRVMSQFTHESLAIKTLADIEIPPRQVALL